jgi:tetraacyldisaccharide 4'-kinase
MRAPVFWKGKGVLSTALLPVSALYYGAARVRRAVAAPEKLPAKIICVGNLVAGGAGKTPVALALGEMLKGLGKNAHYLSRGYKSASTGVTRVDPARHSARDVGDEPLLLAEVLPAWVAKDRVSGARAAIRAGAEIIIMDDGFQNPYLHQDVSLLVIDGHYGTGNGRLIPSGPLREPVVSAMRRANAVILIGEDRRHMLRDVPSGIKILHASVRCRNGTEFLKDRQVLMFCGIAHPHKFYHTLHRLGCVIRKHVAYPDHHAFTPEDMQFLHMKAKELGCMLVTTEKDFVRLPEDSRAEVSVVPIEVVFDDNAALLETVLS